MKILMQWIDIAKFWWLNDNTFTVKFDNQQTLRPILCEYWQDKKEYHWFDSVNGKLVNIDDIIDKKSNKLVKDIMKGKRNKKYNDLYG